MWRNRLTYRDIQDNAEAVALALLVHVLIAGMMFWGMRWSFEVERPAGTVIEAQVVDVSNVIEEMERERREREQAQAAEQARIEREAAERAAERQRQQEEAERQRQVEQARQRELERQRQAELEAIQQEREEAARRAEEAQRQVEALEERRRQEEAERRRQAEAERQRELLEQERAAQRRAAQAGKEAEWISSVKAVVTRSWIRPPTARAGLSCTVSVRVIPGGEVINASIVEPCNADDATRRSIINAVHSASPLPYRGYEDVFQRSFNFRFTYDG